MPGLGCSLGAWGMWGLGVESHQKLGFRAVRLQESQGFEEARAYLDLEFRGFRV